MQRRGNIYRLRPFSIVLFLCIFLLTWFPPARAHAQATGGNWVGTLSEPNAPQDYFNYGMVLQQGANGVVTGTSWNTIASEPEYYALYSVTGTFSADKNEFTFQEGTILSQLAPPDEHWCPKSGTLTLSGDAQTLSGNWTAPGCEPGSLTISATLPLKSTSLYVNVPRTESCSQKTGICSAIDASLYTKGLAMGTLATMAGGLQNLFCFLDFGGPVIRKNMFGAAAFHHFLYPSEIKLAVLSFANGFLDGNNGTSALTIGVGTNNYNLAKNLGSLSGADGAAWAQMVTSINTLLKKPAFAGQVTVVGASDIEQENDPWSTPSLARSWVNGYQSASSSSLYNYGEDVIRNGWTMADVLAVSPIPFPEMYSTGLGNAKAWQRLSAYAVMQTGAPLNLAGPLTQNGACIQKISYPPPCLPGTDNTAPVAWQQLTTTLDNDPDTAEGLIWSTDISYLNLPP
jgi:hypothetical protein